MEKLERWVAPVILSVLFLQACEGGVDRRNGGDDPDNDISTPATLNGVFIDDPVAGLQYRSGTGPIEITDADGGFTYIDGEPLSFFVDGVLLGTLPNGAEQITPYDFGAAAGNIARFLQSLDTTPDASGIDLTNVDLAATAIDFSQPDAEFGADPAVQAAVSAARAAGGRGLLVDRTTALLRLNAVLRIFTEVDFDDVALFTRSSGATRELCLTLVQAGGSGEHLCQDAITANPQNPGEPFDWRTDEGGLILEYGDPVAKRVRLTRLQTEGNRVAVSSTQQCFPSVDPNCTSQRIEAGDIEELVFAKPLQTNDLTDRILQPANLPMTRHVFDNDGTAVVAQSGMIAQTQTWSVDPAFHLLSRSQTVAPGSSPTLQFSQTILIDGTVESGAFAEVRAEGTDANGNGLLDASEIESGLIYQTVTAQPMALVPNAEPAFTSGASVDAPENSAATGYVATALDADADSLAYSLEGGADQAAFVIDAGSGALSFNAPPDFENPLDAGADNAYEVQLRVEDGNGGRALHLVTVRVTDVDENRAPLFISGGAALAVENETATGYTAAAFDPDGDAVSYDLAGGADLAHFSIGSASGLLTFVAAPDFENPGDADADNDYEVTIQARDANGATASRAVTVSVGGVNEAPVFTSVANVAAAENATATGYTAAATDPEDDALTYDFGGGADDALFDLDATTGVLTFRAAPDFEVPQDANGDNRYEVTVDADDGNGAVAAQSITVTVTGENENPAFASAGAVSTPENRVSTGYTAAATDPDGDTLTFSLGSGADEAGFSIDPASGALTFDVAPDFENPLDADGDNRYELVIHVADGNGGSAMGGVTVTVTDENEAVFDLAGQWRVTTSFGDNDCGVFGAVLDEVAVSHQGAMVTFMLPTGESLTGTLAGNQIDATGSYPEDGGTTTIDAMTLTVGPDADTLAGGFTWTWTNSSINCTGVASQHAQRIDEASGFSIDGVSLHARTHEDATEPGGFGGVLALSNAGRGILQSEVANVELRDPDSLPVNPLPGAPEFFIDHYLALDWDQPTAAFIPSITPDASYYGFNLDNQSDLAAGEYTFSVSPVTGGTVERMLQFPGSTTVPAVPGVTIQTAWVPPRGDLRITWPAASVDAYRIELSTDNAPEYVRAAIPGSVSEVLVPRSAVDWLEAKSAALGGYTDTLNLSFETRDQVDGSTVSRHLSLPLQLTRPSRGRGGWTLDGAADAFFRHAGGGCSVQSGPPETGNCSLVLSGFGSQVSVDYSWQGPRPDAFPDASFTVTDGVSGTVFTGTGALGIEPDVFNAPDGEDAFDRVTFTLQATPVGGGNPVPVAGDVVFTSVPGGGSGAPQ